MTIIMFTSFLAFFLYLQLSLYVLFNNPSAKLNRVFFLLCTSLMIWSFGTIFLTASTSQNVYKFWERLSSFGWIFFPAFLVSFFYVLKKNSRILISHLIQLFFYLSALLFFIQSLLGNLLTSNYYYFNNNWQTQVNSDSIWFWLYLAYLLLSLLISISLLIKWGMSVTTAKEKKQAKVIMITLITFFTGIMICNYVLPLFMPASVPQLIHIISFIWVTGFSFAIVRYKFLVLNLETAANDIIAKMKELLFFVDNNGKIVKVNQFTEEILGFSQEEIAEQLFDTLLVKDDEEIKNVSKFESKEEFNAIESYLRRKCGEVIPFHLSSAEVKDAFGDKLGTIIVGYDARYQKLLEHEIDLRKKTEEALRNSEKKHRELYSMVRLMCDNVPDMIWAKDLDSNFVFTNKATYEKLLNVRDINEAIGKSADYFFNRERESHIENPYWFTYGTKSIDTDEITIRTRETGRYLEFGNVMGKFLYNDVYKAPFWDENGELIGVVGCARDITKEKQIEDERIRAEKALAAEKEFLSVTLKSIGDGVITTDTSGKIIIMNKAAETITGWNKDEVWGQPLSEVFNIKNAKTNEKLESPVTRVLAKKKTIYLEKDTLLITKSGKAINIADSGAPIMNREGQIIGVVIVFSDVTDKQRIENELIKIQKLETVGVLAGGIAHDFNNILTAITGNLSLAMLQEKENSKVMKRLTDAERACFRARDLTQQLLTFSKGGAPLKKVVQIKKLIKESALFATRGSNTYCEFQIAEDLALIEVDEGQLLQVINNLVINAKQALPDGGVITVTSNNYDIQEDSGLPLKPGKYVRIIVSDNGVGIPEKHLEHIFDPFYTTKQKGSGLGLTSSFGIVQKHEGYLTAQSELGKGSVFTIYLPASESELPDEIETIEEDIDFKSEGLVMLMDDERDIRNTLRSMLEGIGFSVINCSNGEEMINQYRQMMEEKRKVSFVILDLTIPGGMGGKEVIKILKTIDDEVKAIFSSGYSNDPVLNNFELYGFKAILEKPYTYKKLIQVVRKVTDNCDTFQEGKS